MVKLYFSCPNYFLSRNLCTWTEHHLSPNFGESQWISSSAVLQDLASFRFLIESLWVYYTLYEKIWPFSLPKWRSFTLDLNKLRKPSVGGDCIQNMSTLVKPNCFFPLDLQFAPEKLVAIPCCICQINGYIGRLNLPQSFQFVFRWGGFDFLVCFSDVFYVKSLWS